MPQQFIVGERYFDHTGNYTVVAIHGKKLKIKYDDGKEKEADLDIKARIYWNIIAENKAVHPYQSHGFFRTLGFLAGRGEFQAEVPPKSQDAFEERYRKLTGKRPSTHHDKYFPIDVISDYDKWGPELRIYIPARSDLEFPPDVELRAGTTTGTVRINNNEFWWQLVRVGFRLGTAHDVQRIRKSIPAVGNFSADFDAGLKF